MNRQRLFRGLRIAWSVVFGILCLMLVALWVRSYWKFEGVARMYTNRIYSVDSGPGSLVFSRGPPGLRAPPPGWYFVAEKSPLANYSRITGLAFDEGHVFSYERYDDANTAIKFPHWAPLIVFSALAVLPWLPWSPRFSLRTLFIVVTVVAVLLGLCVYFIRR